MTINPQVSIYAAIFDGSTPVRILRGTAKQLNANTKGGKVWRAIDETVTRTQDVPALETLVVHPLFVARED